MSINRCRNVFTLSDFHFPPSPAHHSKAKLKRRQNVDVFEKDPFKIQSYNFRYAERPKFPMPVLPETNNNSSATNDCRTFFYNDEFPHNSNAQRSYPQNHDSRSMNLTKFQEYRRKKYLQDASLSRNLTSSSYSANNNSGITCATVNKPHSSKLFNLYYGNNQRTQQYKPNCDQYYAKFGKSTYPYVAKSVVETKTYQKSVGHNLNICRDMSNSSSTNGTRKESKEQTGSLAAFMSSSKGINGNSTQPTTAPPLQQRPHQSQATTSRGVCINRRRSSSSGCEINININSTEDDSRSENVIIKIETESKNRSSSSFNKPQLERLTSSSSFFIDKRLSKFSLNKERPEPVNSSRIQPGRVNVPRDKQHKSRTDEIKLLTAVYSPQLLQTKPKSSLIRLAQSRERLPSMFPFRSYSDLGTYHENKSNDKLPPKKTNIQRVSENMAYSFTNIKNYTKSNEPSCSYNVSSNDTKLLNSTALTNKHSFLKRFNSSTHSLNPRLTEKTKVSSLHSMPVVTSRIELKSINPNLYRSHSKLPINVNINVFADKLKFLKT